MLGSTLRALNPMPTPPWADEVFAVDHELRPALALDIEKNESILRLFLHERALLLSIGVVLLNGPFGDGNVDFRLEADGLAQGRYDFAVVPQNLLGLVAVSRVINSQFFSAFDIPESLKVIALHTMDIRPVRLVEIP